MYNPMISWEVPVANKGLKIEFEIGGVWSSPAASVVNFSDAGLESTNGVVNYYPDEKPRYAAYFDISKDIFKGLEIMLDLYLSDAAGVSGDFFIDEIENTADTYTRGGMHARRLCLKITKATGFTRFRIKAPGGGKTDIIPMLGGVATTTYTSGTDLELTLPFAYDGAFFLPYHYARKARTMPLVYGNVRRTQDLRSSTVIRKKTAQIQLEWQAVPGSMCSIEMQQSNDQRNYAGVAAGETFLTLENFWHACVIGSAKAVVFFDGSEHELDCSTCATYFFVDFSSPDMLAFENLLMDRYADTGRPDFDIVLLGLVLESPVLRLT